MVLPPRLPVALIFVTLLLPSHAQFIGNAGSVSGCVSSCSFCANAPDSTTFVTSSPSVYTSTCWCTTSVSCPGGFLYELSTICTIAVSPCSSLVDVAESLACFIQANFDATARAQLNAGNWWYSNFLLTPATAGTSIFALMQGAYPNAAVMPVCTLTPSGSATAISTPTRSTTLRNAAGLYGYDADPGMSTAAVSETAIKATYRTIGITIAVIAAVDVLFEGAGAAVLLLLIYFQFWTIIGAHCVHSDCYISRVSGAYSYVLFQWYELTESDCGDLTSAECKLLNVIITTGLLVVLVVLGHWVVNPVVKLAKKTLRPPLTTLFLRLRGVGSDVSSAVKVPSDGVGKEDPAQKSRTWTDRARKYLLDPCFHVGGCLFLMLFVPYMYFCAGVLADDYYDRQFTRRSYRALFVIAIVLMVLFVLVAVVLMTWLIWYSVKYRRTVRSAQHLQAHVLWFVPRRSHPHAACIEACAVGTKPWYDQSVLYLPPSCLWWGAAEGKWIGGERTRVTERMGPFLTGFKPQYMGLFAFLLPIYATAATVLGWSGARDQNNGYYAPFCVVRFAIGIFLATVNMAVFFIARPLMGDNIIVIVALTIEYVYFILVYILYLISSTDSSDATLFTFGVERFDGTYVYWWLRDLDFAAFVIATAAIIIILLWMLANMFMRWLRWFLDLGREPHFSYDKVELKKAEKSESEEDSGSSLPTTSSFIGSQFYFPIAGLFLHPPPPPPPPLQ